LTLFSAGRGSARLRFFFPARGPIAPCALSGCARVCVCACALVRVRVRVWTSSCRCAFRCCSLCKRVAQDLSLHAKVDRAGQAAAAMEPKPPPPPKPPYFVPSAPSASSIHPPRHPDLLANEPPLPKTARRPDASGGAEKYAEYQATLGERLREFLTHSDEVAARTAPHAIPSHLTRLDEAASIPSHPVPSRPISPDPIPSHQTCAVGPIASHPIPSHPISSCLIPSHHTCAVGLIPSHLISSHPISSQVAKGLLKLQSELDSGNFQCERYVRALRQKNLIEAEPANAKPSVEPPHGAEVRNGHSN
jgi:hypothetical protein